MREPRGDETTRAVSAETTDVLLCSMPFGNLVTPSLALGLLQASVAHLPVRVRQRYLSLRFAGLLGFAGYQHVANRWQSGHEEIGEWVFAQSMFVEHTLDAKGYVERILREPPTEHRPFLTTVPEHIVSTALEARRRVEPFLEACLEDVRRMTPRIVGFTCMTQQRLASLALARRIKEQLPETYVVFGGVDCEGIRGAEIVRRFSFVDAVVSGQADSVFPEIVLRVSEGRAVEGILGVLTQHEERRTAHTRVPLNAQTPANLDELPLPSFDDYFEESDIAGLPPTAPIYLSLETSRGCWWGQKSHCAFCSINGTNLKYSRKSAGRVVEEVEFFANRYPGKRIVMTDSVLDSRLLQPAIPTLAERGLDLEIQYEARATLSKDQLQCLRAGGVRAIQPGIESLSTAILQLMRKGTSLLHNIRILKWGIECGVSMFWNLLIGFPDEPPEAYEEMARLVPFLTHLQPPSRFRMVELGRHSPLFEEAEHFGLTDIAPSPAYRYIYPFDADVLANLAVYFTYGFRSAREIGPYTEGLQDAVEEWWRVHPTSALIVAHESDRSLVWDERPFAEDRFLELNGVEHAILQACDDILRIEELVQVVAERFSETASPDDVRGSLQTLTRRGFVVTDRGKVLSLAVNVPPNEIEDESARAILDRIGSDGRSHVDPNGLQLRRLESMRLREALRLRAGSV